MITLQLILVIALIIVLCIGTWRVITRPYEGVLNCFLDIFLIDLLIDLIVFLFELLAEILSDL